MVKAGQIYKAINAPEFYTRLNPKPFLTTHVWFTSVSIIYSDGETDRVGIDWVKGDCKLIKEFDSWEEAITSKEFKNI